MAILTPVRLYKDIDLSFSAHPETKDVVKKIDINSVKQSLKLLLFSSYNERPFREDTTVFSSIRNLLFEPVDILTSISIKRNIEYIVETYEPRVILDEVVVSPNDEKNEYEISIYFRVKGIQRPASFSTILTRAR